jgi:hypothetical protein
VRIITERNFKRSAIVSPAENLVIGDKQPYGSPPVWGSSLWWPNSCMDFKASTSKAFEGVEPKRHLGTAVISFNDGHSEARKDSLINPPMDPGSGMLKIDQFPLASLAVARRESLRAEPRRASAALAELSIIASALLAQTKELGDLLYRCPVGELVRFTALVIARCNRHG